MSINNKILFLALPLFIAACTLNPDLKTVEGTVRLGHEVRSFTDKQNNQEYWLIDKSGRLIQEYKKAINGDIMKYQPLQAKLHVKDLGKQKDGFAADYDGTYEVKDILYLAK